MAEFSKISLARLQTCHPDLQQICNALLEEMDISIVCGYRDEADQMTAYENGLSKLKWPNSKHNLVPAQAVDIAPYDEAIGGIDWNDIKAFNLMLDRAQAIADGLGIKIMLGRDFKSLGDIDHMELAD